MEQITYEVLKAMIEELIKEFNKKIKKERMSICDLRISKVHMKKEFEVSESISKSLNRHLQESYTKVENIRREKEKLED